MKKIEKVQMVIDAVASYFEVRPEEPIVTKFSFENEPNLYNDDYNWHHAYIAYHDQNTGIKIEEISVVESQSWIPRSSIFSEIANRIEKGNDLIGLITTHDNDYYGRTIRFYSFSKLAISKKMTEVKQITVNNWINAFED
jgi:hypothetical protein